VVGVDVVERLGWVNRVFRNNNEEKVKTKTQRNKEKVATLQPSVFTASSHQRSLFPWISDTHERFFELLLWFQLPPLLLGCVLFIFSLLSFFLPIPTPPFRLFFFSLSLSLSLFFQPSDAKIQKQKKVRTLTCKTLALYHCCLRNTSSVLRCHMRANQRKVT
jgi:hypothetical protein